MSLFATKSIDKIVAEAAETGEHTLKKTLSGLDLTMLGIGAIIGTGIFVLTGQAAGKHAGPAVVISMIIAGVTGVSLTFAASESRAKVAAQLANQKASDALERAEREKDAARKAEAKARREQAIARGINDFLNKDLLGAANAEFGSERYSRGGHH